MKLLFSRFRALSMRKQTSKNDSQTQVLDLDDIFNFHREQAFFTGMYTDTKFQNGKSVPYKRDKPIEQIRFDNFLSRIVNPMDDNKPYRSGNGNCRRLSEGDTPKNVVSSITRLRTNDNTEYLLLMGYI